MDIEASLLPEPPPQYIITYKHHRALSRAFRDFQSHPGTVVFVILRVTLQLGNVYLGQAQSVAKVFEYSNI